MIRTLTAALLLVSAASAADAQRRVMTGAQDTGMLDSGSIECRIAETAFTRGGGGFVCDTGPTGRIFMATDGGTRPGGISAFMSWLIEARNSQTSARDSITVHYDTADNASQAICDETGLRGASARNPIPCYRILAVID
ncbi:hypothetical protein V0U79_05415 [Hyphobacterium sp. HN65]|uniref:Uncharacterized protein n=1 Tax=Hyphobacterium lacteum TaxID=3116575 RepID=A0ABU7LPG9_9PROT|nr:hypothetical protein [Hyphobacterium sp. HN65]MEE2525797.1 hypothetical protein [Hyphobacterium sp. HN65]